MFTSPYLFRVLKVTFPPVAAICPIYFTSDKLAALNECAASFLHQSYEGPKELVILNDNPNTKLVCNSNTIRVCNLPMKLPTFGDRYNLLLDLASPALVVFPWEFMDISLPHRITQGIHKLNGARGLKMDYFDPEHVFIETNGSIKKDHSQPSCTHYAGCFAREKLRYPSSNEKYHEEAANLAHSSLRVYEEGIGDKASNWTYILREYVPVPESQDEGNFVVVPDKKVAKEYVNNVKLLTEAYVGKRT